jgi:hypothetical protein
MSNQQPSASNNNNMPLGSQQIRYEDINDEYIAQLLSNYWPQPQDVSWGTSQPIDIPVPFSPTTMNGSTSTSNYQPSQDTSNLPVPPALVPSQGYHQITFDELMRQIDRERELALVPQAGDATLSIRTTSLQRSVNPPLKGLHLLTKHPASSFGQPFRSSTQLPGFQGQPIGSSSFPGTTVPDITIPAYNIPAAPITQTSAPASRRGSVSVQVNSLDQRLMSGS